MFLLAAASAAQAGTVQVSRSGPNSFFSYEAGPGERNDLVLGQAGDTITVRDSAGVTPGVGCSPDPANATGAVCAFRQSVAGDSVTVKLGDLDDRVAANTGTATLEGGPGDDVLTAPPNGGAQVEPGPGNDEAIGGAGEDFFFEAGPGEGSDVYRGGGGPDTLNMSARTSSVRIDLEGDRDDGAPGENDLVGSDIESVYTGSGDDLLTGNAADNTLAGGGGSDALAGGAGDDSLQGNFLESRRAEPGRDTVDGGPGADALSAGGGPSRLTGGPGRDRFTGGPSGDDIRALDGKADNVEGCGGGRDSVRVDRLDFVGAAGRDRCERIRRRGRASAVLSDTRLHSLSLGPNDVAVGCPADGPRRCKGRLAVTLGGVRILKRRFSLRRGEERRVDLRLPLAIRKRARTRAVAGRAVVRSRNARGRRARHAESLLLPKF